MRITVSARKPAEARPEEGRGNVTIKFPGEPAVHGNVDCLSVEGQEAGLAGELDNGLFFYIAIQDGDLFGERDRAGLREIRSDFPFSSCKTREEDDIISGGFQVRS